MFPRRASLLALVALFALACHHSEPPPQQRGIYAIATADGGGPGNLYEVTPLGGGNPATTQTGGIPITSCPVPAGYVLPVGGGVLNLPWGAGCTVRVPDMMGSVPGDTWVVQTDGNNITVNSQTGTPTLTWAGTSDTTAKAITPANAYKAVKIVHWTGNIYRIYGVPLVALATGTGSTIIDAPGTPVAIGTSTALEIGLGASAISTKVYGTLVSYTPQAVAVGTSIASATTIAPSASVTHITGTAAIATITVPAGCVPYNGCVLTLVPDGAFTWVTSGNIATSAGTATVGVPILATYDSYQSKWYLK